MSTLEIILYSAIAVAQVVILVWYFRKSSLKSKKEKEKRDALTREYPFDGLRNIALNTSPGAIIANVPENEVLVYSAVMDWDMGSDIVTLVTQLTGDVSMYVKSGGGIIGAGKYPEVSAAAQNFTRNAQTFLEFVTPANETTLPPKNCVQFFLLTNKGKFHATELYSNIENGTSRWAGLFNEANSLMSIMRKFAFA